MEENLILEGLLSMVTELKEKQEQQVTPASREETINRLDVIEQRILEIRNKSGIPENMVQEILNQIGSIRKGPSENQKKDLQDIKGMIVASHRYFKERLKVLFPADAQQPEKAEPVSRYDKILNWITLFQQPKFLSFFGRNYYLPCITDIELPFCRTYATVTGQRYKIPLSPDERKGRGKRHQFAGNEFQPGTE